MSLCVIELNDSGIRVAKGAEIVLENPGYAVIDKHHIEVGQAAFDRAHLHPHQLFNRFWQQLDQVPLKKSSKRCRHHADLAFLHLEQIYKQAGSPDDLMFAVPGSFSDEQLSLLLGIAQACRINTVGLVDAAVAAAAAVVGPGEYTHVDIQQHQTVFTGLEVTDQVNRTRVECTDEAGLNKIYGACIAQITDVFLEQSRFDPLHHADTEQQLYDQLPQWFEQLEQAPEIVIAVKHRGAPFEARISRNLILQTLRPFYSAIDNRVRETTHCLVTDRLGRLPGFCLAAQTCDQLAPEAVFSGCCANVLTIQRTGEQGLSHVTRLPASKQPTLAVQSSVQTSAAQPQAGTATHILSGHRAYELSSAPLFLSAQGQVDRRRVGASACGVSRDGARISLTIENGATVLLNGAPISGTAALNPGDRITFREGDVLFTPIAVIDGNGP